MPGHHAVALSLEAALQDLKPTPASYLSTARQIAASAWEGLLPLRVSVLSSFTAEILRPYLIVEGARRGLGVDLAFCPFNQIEQQAFNPDSELYQSQPEVIMVALEFADVAPDLIWRYPALSTQEIEAALTTLEGRLKPLLEQLRRQSPATLLIFNFALPPIAAVGLADPGLELPQSSAVARANEALANLCRSLTDVFVVDYARLTTVCGLSQWYDARLQHTARIPFGASAQMALGANLARYLRVVRQPSCKCLVLDLDNTLWGGVLGEDGIGGIALGEDYPGSVYKEFQRYLVTLRDQGVLLALASKNNAADVQEAFARHDDMVLSLDDFAATQIHWGDKATSLQAIAEALNIGVDALAFFDDNPVERAWVRERLPDVTVIDVPAEPLQYMTALEASGAFDRLRITEVDRQRPHLVQQARKREQFYDQAGSVEAFLRGLEMVATVGHLDAVTLPRVAQLLAKTNQFNLTTRRHTAAALQVMVETGAVVLWMRLKDRFGDNGLVGVAIGVPMADTQWRIDSFLLSCRVIGRQADDVLLGMLGRRVAARGGRALVGEYLPTPKNQQVAGFYEAHGFRPLDDTGQTWALELTERALPLPDSIRIETVEDLTDA